MKLLRNIKNPRNWMFFILFPVIAYASISILWLVAAVACFYVWLNTFQMDFSDENFSELGDSLSFGCTGTPKEEKPKDK